MNNSLKPETLCVQGGWQPKKGEPRVLPIYQSTTFKYDTSEQMAKLFDLEESGYFYTRLQNPTNDAVAAKIAALEGGVGAMLTSSGQAANFYAVFNICQAGDHMVCFGRRNIGCFPSEHKGFVWRNLVQSGHECARYRKVCPYRPQSWCASDRG